ncbi:hypothetical protein K525DRAFT_150942, partial [Schizophyllum commune Loenen D]
YYLDEGDIVVRADNTLFRFHSFHLQHDTTYFDGAITNLSASSCGDAVGSADDNSLTLNDVKAQDFEHLLWFFYDSAYKWSGIADSSHTPKWDIILTLADKFKMRRVAKVACYALGRANALSDVRKIALCVQYDMGKDWITEELVRVISRHTPLSMDEGEEMGARMTTVMCKARESMRYRPSLDAIEDYVFPVHAYHLKKASKVFVDMFSLPSYSATSEGGSHDSLITLDVKAKQFNDFIWFLYDSSYAWSYAPDPQLTTKWEGIFCIADMFAMEEVCRVAAFALDHNGGLPDVRKISLCVRYSIDKSWATEAIKRVCVRRDPLTKEEGRDVGVDMAIAIAAAREKAFRRCYTIADEVCLYVLNEIAVENTLFRIHFYHLYRATSFFDKYIESPEGGYSDANPLLLDKGKARDFEHLLWFFYESAYKWSGIVDKEATVKWESILTLAEQYKMKGVAKVACYTLGRANALDDVRKIALCVKYDMGKDWITEELVRIISRANPLSMDEAEEMGARMTAVFSKARESMRHMPSSDAIPACSRAQTADECRECYSRRDMVCEKGIHRCIWTTGHFTICPARDRSTIAAEIPDARTLVRDLHLPDPLSAPTNRVALRDTQDVFLKIENDVLSVHAYHLKRASQTFADMFSLPLTGTSSEGRSQDHPITLNVKGQQFKNFMWFLYESPYAWTYTPNPELTAKWEDILAVGDMFSMAEVCSVATYAIDHNG